MAIVLEANYSKKLGLPGYSSHQYSVTLRTELPELDQVEVESERLHALLQACVDREIQKTGFLPANNDAGAGTGSARLGTHPARTEQWACSEKQQALILRIVEENGLEKREVEALAQSRFGKPVRMLDKLEASGLIDELLTGTGGTINLSRRRLSNGSNLAVVR